MDESKFTEQQIFEINYHRMKAVRFAYSSAFFVSVLTSVKSILGFIFTLLIMVLSLGIVAEGVGPIWVLLSVAKFLVLLFAYNKQYRFIKLTVPVLAASIVLRVVFSLFFPSFALMHDYWVLEAVMIDFFGSAAAVVLNGASIFIELIGAVLWGKAMSMYPEFEALKNERGYPDFNYVMYSRSSEYIPMKERYEDMKNAVPEGEILEHTEQVIMHPLEEKTEDQPVDEIFIGEMGDLSLPDIGNDYDYEHDDIRRKPL